jgi:hypothetical protein
VLTARKTGRHLEVEVVSLQYGNRPALAPTDNLLQFDWELRRSGLKELTQKLTLDRGRNRHVVHAKCDADKGETRIEVKDPKPEHTIVRRGLVLVRLATDTGKLKAEF